MFLLAASLSDQFVNKVLLFLLSKTSPPVVWICRRHLWAPTNPNAIPFTLNILLYCWMPLYVPKLLCTEYFYIVGILIPHTSQFHHHHRFLSQE